MEMKKTIDVAIKLMDRARSMGIPAALESSLVPTSDSRYVILFPRTISEDTIRISSHGAREKRYGISIDGKHLDTAVEIGLNYLEKTYGDGKVQEIIARGGLTPSDTRKRGRSGNGYKSGHRQAVAAWEGKSFGPAHRVFRRDTFGLRAANQIEERPRGKKWRFSPELASDD